LCRYCRLIVVIHTHTHIYIYIYTHTYIHTYIHTIILPRNIGLPQESSIALYTWHHLICAQVFLIPLASSSAVLRHFKKIYINMANPLLLYGLCTTWYRNPGDQNTNLQEPFYIYIYLCVCKGKGKARPITGLEGLEGE
jgi:hypothetical protein